VFLGVIYFFYIYTRQNRLQKHDDTQAHVLVLDFVVLKHHTVHPFPTTLTLALKNLKPDIHFSHDWEKKDNHDHFIGLRH
jgi:hypothetical protein